MGLVLNRPADSTVGEAVPDLSWLAGDAEPVYVGGPVAETAVIVLAEFDRPGAGRRAGRDDLGFIGADADDPERLDGAIRRARVFAGHAGWGPGQLEDELAEEAWIIEPPKREEIFTAEPGRPVGGGAAPQGASLRAAGDDAAGPVPQLNAERAIATARVAADRALDPQQQPVALDEQRAVGEPLVLVADAARATGRRSRARR